MDFQEARDRRDALAPGQGGERRVAMHRRAADARLRRAIREALARQRTADSLDPEQEKAPLRVVRGARP
jgi:hypothetical protein